MPHPQSPFIQLSKSPVDEPSSRFPKWGPYEEMPVSRAFYTYPSRSSAREPSYQVAFTELPQRGGQPPEPVSAISQSPPIKKDAHLQSLPFVNFRTPSKGAPPPGSPNTAPMERDALFPEPLYNYLSQFPVNGPPMG